MSELEQRFSDILWRLYHRPDPPQPWVDDGNLPWNDPAFSQRMLREHLDQSHGAASRVTSERELMIKWLYQKLGLEQGAALLDITCGPGLYAVDFAQRGCQVTGIDFVPAAIAYAREIWPCSMALLADCISLQRDVRSSRFRLPPMTQRFSLRSVGRFPP